MLEIIGTLLILPLFFLYLFALRWVCIIVGIMIGDKSVCHEFVDGCVPIQEQIKSHFTKPPQDTSSDKGHKTGTPANPSYAASHTLDWRQSSQSRR